MTEPSAYKFPLKARADSSYDALKVPNIPPTQLGRATLSMNLASSRNAAPLRVPVIQREFNQATVYFVSEQNYLKLWGVLGPSQGEPEKFRAFVAPQHRLITVCLFTRELQGVSYQHGTALLSPLRQLEIHQAIRYGLTRLRGASEARSRACLSAGFERWQDTHGITLRSNAQTNPHSGESAKSIITAGPVQVSLLSEDEWDSMSKTRGITGQTFVIDSTPERIICVTTREQLQTLTEHLREQSKYGNNLQTALAVQALYEHVRREPFTELSQHLLNQYTNSELGLTELKGAKPGSEIEILVHRLETLAQEFEEPLGNHVARGRAWKNLLFLFSSHGTDRRLFLASLDNVIEQAWIVLEEWQSRAKLKIPTGTSEIKEDIRNWMSNPLIRTLSDEIRGRLRDRIFLPDHQGREARARQNGLGQSSPRPEPIKETQLINHQCSRLSPGPAAGAYLEELRANSLFHIAPDVIPSSNLIKPKQLSGATYLQIKWEFKHTIDIVGVGKVSCLLLIRHHSRTQGKKEEYPGYRYSLDDIKVIHDSTQQSASKNFILDALNIPIVRALPTIPKNPFILNNLSAAPSGPRLFHPALGKQSIPLTTLGFHISSCSRYVFGRSIRDPGLKFVDLEHKPLRGNLQNSLGTLFRDRQQCRDAADQLVDYFEQIAHFVHIPSNMNLALEPLDFELWGK